jgi:uncharacterized protein
VSISMFSASVPVFQAMLTNLGYFIDKADAHCTAKKIDPAALTGFRLAPDMLPFTRQVLIACDAAKNGIMRIGNIEAPKFADDEQTFTELKARIQKTLDYLATVTPEQLNGSEDKDITFPVGPDKTHTMKAEAYLKHWVTPNLYFHVTTAYAILRHNGVDLGKREFLMGARAMG